ncbi:ligand-gated channel [Bacteroidia bacterium]|nr:ligand-gated channel [Bacteroidia bacterium]
MPSRKGLNNMVKHFLFFIFGFLLLVHDVSAQDSLHTRVLDEVEVRTIRPSTFLSTSSTQVLQTDNWAMPGASQVSDAVKHFSGVQVKDYGGVGGLKTVSIRSLGANHLGVIYDGVPVSDMQTGQIDLGRFSLNSVDMLSLTIGESDLIFQTAQAQALAGALNIVTQGIAGQARDDSHALNAAVNVGSFGLINPSGRYSKPLSQALTLNFSADYLATKGDYPFAQPIGYGDEKQYKKRENSDVETLKLEANLIGNFKNGGNLLFKNQFYTSNRGLPGAAIFYKDEPYYDRLKDHHFFSQMHYQQPLSEKFQFQTNAKFSVSHTDYFNPTLQPEKQTSVYDQREFYLNATFLYQPTGKISFSWANDGSYSTMEGNQMVVSPSRASWLSAFSGKYEIKQFSVTAKLLNTNIHDAVERQTTDYNHLTPYLGFSLQPLNNLPLRIRGFYKNTFRMPTFGDLYYSTTHTYLKPENAQQYDLGVTWVAGFWEKIPYFSVNADVYWNQVRDKIVAVPTRSLFWWSMENYGKVAITGIDLNTSAHIRCNSQFLWKMTGTYTYQNALNKIAEKPATYNKLLPYTARHSASGNFTLQTPWVNAGYSIIYCGKRYNRADNVPISQMPPFTEHGINLMHSFTWQKTKITLSAECLNLGNMQYEVVNSYPMPTRSFRFGIKINY